MPSTLLRFARSGAGDAVEAEVTDTVAEGVPEGVAVGDSDAVGVGVGDGDADAAAVIDGDVDAVGVSEGDAEAAANMARRRSGAPRAVLPGCGGPPTSRKSSTPITAPSLKALGTVPKVTAPDGDKTPRRWFIFLPGPPSLPRGQTAARVCV